MVISLFTHRCNMGVVAASVVATACIYVARTTSASAAAAANSTANTEYLRWRCPVGTFAAIVFACGQLGARANAPSAKPTGQQRKTEYCFAWNRKADGCREPCPQDRLHSCEGCGKVGARVIHCCHKDGPPAKQQKTKGKGKGKKGTK